MYRKHDIIGMDKGFRVQSIIIPHNTASSRIRKKEDGICVRMEVDVVVWLCSKVWILKLFATHVPRITYELHIEART